ncbi:neural proliferation differentiation and control protein 1 [Rhinophrynus dorsalis]
MGGPWGSVSRLLGLIVLGLGVRETAGRQADACPGKIDCALQRREFCSQGSAVCGPCIQGFEESSDGKCQTAAKYKTGKETLSLPDANIDYLASILSKQDSSLQDSNLQDSGLQPSQDGKSTPAQPPLPPIAPPNGPSGRTSNSTEIPGNPRKVPNGHINDSLILGVVVTCAFAGLLALFAAGICWCRMHKEQKLAEQMDYSSFKASPPPPYEKTSPGDKKLAQSAQMYHYQHQKQQMLSMEKNKDEPKHPDSALTSDEENEDGDFTVYECPGLAPTGEMEVKNPLFDDSSLQTSTHNIP